MIWKTSRQIWDKIDLTYKYYRSKFNENKNTDLYNDVLTYCMFVGHGRSGHSLVGSLLDAHPDAVISHELDALKYIQAGFSRNQLFDLILENSREFSSSGRKWTGYSYEVQDQWQGRYQRLNVIGDKRGGGSTKRLAKDPRLLIKLKDAIGINVMVINVLRNPYDNIARRYIRSRDKQRKTVDKCIDDFFDLTSTIADIRKNVPKEEFLDSRLETLIEAPQEELTRICDFLGLDAYPDYLESCAGIIFKSPKKSRDKIEWTGSSIMEVDNRIKQFSSLKGYNFEN